MTKSSTKRKEFPLLETNFMVKMQFIYCSTCFRIEMHKPDIFLLKIAKLLHL